MRRTVHGIVVLAACVAALGVSCRRNAPSLVDRNQPPDTQLWYAPPDSTDYEYLVHLYWRGVDGDGTAQRFIWTIQDTVVTDESSWNPSERISDYRLGRMTSRTDSVFSFTAYKNVSGVGVRKNRQAFYIASIDDNGVIDPTPAAVEFVATIGELPELRFVVYPDGSTPRPYQNRTPPADTVGMFAPFAISYHGFTTNGSIKGYKYFPLNPDVTIPGQGIWNENLSDTLREFPNTAPQALPSGVLKFAAQCIDGANAESQVDAGRFTVGVAQVVVNFDPDTWVSRVRSIYFRGGSPVTEDVPFTDGVPDTVPQQSWLYYEYSARDDPRDVWRCETIDPDKCINFQVKYRLVSTSGNTEDSGWLPRNGVHDSDANSATDSNTVSIGSLDYDWYVRSFDENETVDGTPPSFHVVGNFRPVLDTSTMRDHFGNALDFARVDTLEWDFYKPVGWPSADSSAAGSGYNYQKRFAWTINATGHDHAKDPEGSAVQSWRFFAFTNYVAGAGENPGSGNRYPLGRAGDSWFPGTAANEMQDRFELLVRYNDPEGDDLFATIPDRFPWMNQVITIVLYGRDSPYTGGGEFTQYVYWDPVPPNQVAGSGISGRNIINSFGISSLGRWTPKKVWSFYLRFSR